MSVRSSVTTRHGEIAYLERGRGPTALFVHGVLLNAHLWDATIELLASDRQCVAVDLMGHGDTVVALDQDLSFVAQAEMLIGFIDALGVDQVDLVANDSGGAIAQILAARSPERVRSLTLTNCDTHDNVFPPAVVPLFEAIKSAKLLEIVEPMQADPSVARAFFASTLERPADLSDETVRAFVEPLIRNEKTGRCVQRWVEAVSADDLAEVTPLLGRITAPTLIVWGTDDVFFDVDWAHWLRGRIPGAIVVEVPGARLFFPLERPSMLADQIRSLWGTAVVPSQP